MKRNTIILLILALSSVATWAQVGIGTNTPDASAVLEIQSTTKGVLIPRMTKAQMAAITPRVEGLMVYCSDCDIKSLYVYDGTNYINLINGGETVAYQPFNKAVSPWDKKYVRLAIVTLPEYPAKHVAIRFGKSMP